MTDNLTPTQRRKNMSAVRNRETSLENALRSDLHRRGFRFRKNVKQLPGSPDIVLPRYRAVVFVHGCFWHGHVGCKKASLPATRTEFWAAKVQKNKTRDQAAVSALSDMDRRIAIIWGCALKNKTLRQETVAQLCAWLKEGQENRLTLPRVPKKPALSSP